MQKPIEPGLDPSSVIPPTIGTERESTEPAIALESQLATAASSTIPVAPKRRQGKELPMRAAKKLPIQATKSKRLTSTSISDSKRAINQTQNESSVDNEDDDIHEAVGSNDLDYQEMYSYDEINAIMPRFKPINDWNKNIDVVRVFDIFAASLEGHKKIPKMILSG